MEFILVKNQLIGASKSGKYVAKAKVTQRLDKSHLIEKISYGCTLTQTDILAVLASLESVVVEYLVLGCSIDLGFVYLFFSIQGTFDTLDERFRKEKHRICINAKLSSALSEAVREKSNPIRKDQVSKNPRPRELSKVSGKLEKKAIEPGNMLRLYGSRLYFDMEDKEAGVFFTSDKGKSFRAKEYGQVKDTCIILKIPDEIKSGIHIVEVRSRSKSGKINTGVLEEPVDIAA